MCWLGTLLLGNPYAVGIAVSNSLALSRDFGKKGKASDIFNQSLNISAATALGVVVGGNFGPVLGAVSAFSSGKYAFGLSTRDALTASVGATSGVYCINNGCAFSDIKSGVKNFFNLSPGAELKGGTTFIPSP